jgi:predicted nucleic acid-binding protein
VARVTSIDATLDANVLIPITLCDTLLRLAEGSFFRPHWSEETLDEVIRNLVKRVGVSLPAAQRRVDNMTMAFPEALVEGYKRLIPAMPNDPKDRHVLAAAVRSGSQVVVTSNLRHFASELLREFEIEAQPPDLFLLHQSALDPKATATIVRGQAADKTKPPRSVADVVDYLSIDAPRFAQAMRLLLDLPAQGELALPTSPELMPLVEELEAVRVQRREGS